MPPPFFLGIGDSDASWIGWPIFIAVHLSLFCLHAAAKVAAVLRGVVSTKNARDGLGIGKMFLFENARRQGFRCVVVVDRDGLLQNDDAVIDSLVNEMDRAAGHLCSVIKRLLLRVEPRKRRQQR